MVFSRSEGHMEVFRCSACGCEVAGTSYPAGDVPRLEYELEPFRIGLAQAAGIEDIAVLRRLFPELADRSISDLKSTLRQGHNLGIRPRREAERLQLEAQEAGIALTLELVAASSMREPGSHGDD